MRPLFTSAGQKCRDRVWVEQELSCFSRHRGPQWARATLDCGSHLEGNELYGFQEQRVVSLGQFLDWLSSRRYSEHLNFLVSMPGSPHARHPAASIWRGVWLETQLRSTRQGFICVF